MGSFIYTMTKTYSSAEVYEYDRKTKCLIGISKRSFTKRFSRQEKYDRLCNFLKEYKLPLPKYIHRKKKSIKHIWTVKSLEMNGPKVISIHVECKCGTVGTVKKFTQKKCKKIMESKKFPIYVTDHKNVKIKN